MVPAQDSTVQERQCAELPSQVCLEIENFLYRTHGFLWIVIILVMLKIY